MLAGGRRMHKGLAKSQGEKSFDLPHWKAKIDEARRLVMDDYPAGCLEWLKVHDPARLERLRATLEEAKAAYLEGNPKSLGKALNAYIRIHFQTFQKFRNRAA